MLAYEELIASEGVAQVRQPRPMVFSPVTTSSIAGSYPMYAFSTSSDFRTPADAQRQVATGKMQQTLNEKFTNIMQETQKKTAEIAAKTAEIAAEAERERQKKDRDMYGARFRGIDVD
jgi:hypothetical protein